MILKVSLFLKIKKFKFWKPSLIILLTIEMIFGKSKDYLYKQVGL